MATLGAASISGVPAFGLPKISSLVAGIFIPTFAASPLWSTSANSVTPLARSRSVSLSTVCSTECWLRSSIIPLSLCGVIVEPPPPRSSVDLRLHHRPGLSRRARRDHQVAALRRRWSPHDLSDLSDRVHDGRSRRIGGESRQGLERATPVPAVRKREHVRSEEHTSELQSP